MLNFVIISKIINIRSIYSSVIFRYLTYYYWKSVSDLLYTHERNFLVNRTVMTTEEFRFSEKKTNIVTWFGLDFWRLRSLSTISQLYCGGRVFIGGGNRITRRKPQTCRKSLTNLITQRCIEYTLPWTGFELTALVILDIDCTGTCKSNYHMITTTTTSDSNLIMYKL